MAELEDHRDGPAGEKLATWREVAVVLPEWVQWIVAKYGPMPDGPVLKEDWERWGKAYTEAHQITD